MAPRSVAYYGWVPDHPDIRDLRYSAPRHLIKALPSRVDLRGACMPVVYDQRSLGSCTANAGSAIFQFNQLQQGIKWPCMPSRLFLYYNTRLLEGTVKQDSGCTIRDTIKTMAARGMCLASDWPYIISKFAVKPSITAYANAVRHTAVRYQRLDSDITQLKGCLANNEAFIFGFSVYTEFESENVARSGVLNMPTASEQMLGGHAVMAVGYDDATQRFIVRNSWGADWGQAGYFTMPYAYMVNTNLVDDIWTVSVVK